MNLSIFFSPKPSIVKHWKPLGLGYKPHQLPPQIEGVWELACRAAPRREEGRGCQKPGDARGRGAAVAGRGSVIPCRDTRRVVQNGSSPQPLTQETGSPVQQRLLHDSSAGPYIRRKQSTPGCRMSGFTTKQSLELWEQLSKWLLLHLNGTALSTPWLI